MKRKRVLAAIISGVALAAVSGGVVLAHGLGFGFGPASNLTPDQLAQQQTDRFQREATLLGISVDDVKNAWAQGQTLEQLANAKGITEAQLQTKLQDARKAELQSQLQTLVQQNVITQAQADQRLKTMEDRIASGQGPGFDRNMHHGMGL